MLPGKQRRIRFKHPMIIHGIIHGQAITLPHHKVIQTMPRRGMHGPCPSLSGHMLTENHRYLTLVQRVLQYQPLQLLPLTSRQHLTLLQLIALQGRLIQLRRQQQTRPSRLPLDLYQHILHLRVQSHCLISRQGPRRSRPDHHRRLGQLLSFKP